MITLDILTRYFILNTCVSSAQILSVENWMKKLGFLIESNFLQMLNHSEIYEFEFNERENLLLCAFLRMFTKMKGADYNKVYSINEKKD